MEILEIKKTPKNAKILNCKFCDFKCCKQSEFNRHVTTDKHKRNCFGNNGNQKNAKKTPDELSCICGKKYSTKSGLWKHKQKCVQHNYTHHLDNSDVKIDKELVMALIKENSELKNIMLSEHKTHQDMLIQTQTQVMELLKNGTTHNTTNMNSNNKNFNLNFFLNETCKNAMNIMDFVNSLQLQLSDLEKMGDIGYVNGMTNIIIKSLKDMDVTERPVHCTDTKREILYVKDQDKWDKETSEKPKIRKAIKHVAHKNAKLLQEFKTQHPDCITSQSKYSDTYNKLMVEAMGGKGVQTEKDQESKIIKRIVRQVALEPKIPNSEITED